MPFLMSSRFESKEASQAPYDTLQHILHERTDLEFSAFRLIQNWPESMSKAPQSTKRWYVVAIGDTPREPVFAQVAEAINQGELAPIPDEVVAMLAERRLSEIAHRPYTEKHYEISVQRSNPKKDKLKRRMQDKSRRRNRGK